MKVISAAFFLVMFWQKKHFRTKKLAKNVDGVDTC